MEFELQASVGHIDFPSSYPWPAEPKQAAGTPNPALERRAAASSTGTTVDSLQAEPKQALDS
jgi:hypothetical protein